MVTIQLQTTNLTLMNSDRKVFGYNMSTARADLARAIRGNFYTPFTSFCRFVNDKSQKLPPACIRNRFGKVMILHHALKDGLADNRVRAITQDKEGAIWVGTWGGGLSRFDGKCFQTIDSRDELVNDLVHSVYLDRSGNVWLGTEGGVVQFTPNKIPPAVYITQLTADKTHENPKEKIKLSSNVSRLSLNYHAISFKTRPGGMKYFYQLVGPVETTRRVVSTFTDDNWQGPTNSETVEYFNLNPGDYTFKVQAVDRDLNYSELASLQLTISPLWHQVGWVRGILAAGSLTFVLTFGFVSWRLAVNRIAKRKLEKELQAREAREAQLQILRYQLNPHFLFNVLNSIRALVNEDHNIARKMIATLSEYLRYSLLNTDSLEVKLKDEIESIRQYLSLEKVRFEDKLEVEIQIDKAAEEARVPVFLLQPLVENAIKYGMRTSEKPLKIRVGARMSARNGRLQIEVSNTGSWIEPSLNNSQNNSLHAAHAVQAASMGIGLKNVRDRLNHAFPGRHSFEIFERDGWVCAVIEISYQQSAI